MSTQTITFRTRLERTANKLTSFFYGKFYPVFVALFTALFYVADLPVIGLSAFAITATIIFICFKDLTPLIPLPIFVVLIFRDFSAFNTITPYISLIPPAIGLIAHFIIYPIKKIFIGKVFIPLILVSVALLIGGVGTPYASSFVRGLITSLTIGPLMLFAYFLFTQYVCPPDDFNLKRHIFYILALLGVTLFIQLLFHEYRLATAEITDYTELGWGNINIGASLLLLTIPSCWYLLFYSKHPVIAVVMLIANYAAAVLSNSDGVMGTAFSFIPIILIWVLTSGELKHAKYKVLKFSFITICAISLLIVLGVVLLDKAPVVLNMFFMKLSNDSARTPMYFEAWEVFKTYPIFGAGQGYVSPNYQFVITGVETFNFHSALFHVIGTMGVFGVIAYASYYVARYKVVMAKNSPFNVFAYIAFSMIEMYAMVDCCEFVAIPTMLCITIFIATVEMANKKGNDYPLPLHIHLNHSAF